MDFGHPHWLWALLLVPIMAIWAGSRVRRQREELLRFTGSRLSESLAPGYSWRKHLLKGTLETLAVALIIFGLAAPRFGSQLVKVEREGIDIVVALDTSLSMLAEDMLPSRLERAKHEIVDLIRGLDGDRVGLVVFAGDAFAMCPLTVDYDAALMFTRSVDVYMVSEPGTAIDKAIRTSVALFDKNSDRDRAVILVTDGENHEGAPLEAAEEARDAGVRVYTIGIGSPRGELIPERGTSGETEGYKKDKKGETVLTRLDESTLQQIASTTNAKYLPATSEGLELKVLYGEISGMNRQAIKGEFVERRKERFYLFLGSALVLLLLDAVVGTRATGIRRRGGRLLHTGVGALVAMSLLLPAVAHAKRVDSGKVKSGNEYYGAQEYDKALTLYKEALGDTLKPPKHSEGVYYNLGNTLFMQQRYQQAIDRYQRSFSEDSTLTGSMLYNRGNAFLMSGNFGAAVESYVQALASLPDDEATRHNLEMALRLLQQQQQQQQQQKDQQGDGDQDQQQQQDEQQQDGKSDQQQQQDQQQQGDQDQQQQDQQQDEDQQQNQPQPADSTQMQPQDSTATVPPAELSPEDLMKLSKEDALRILHALEEQEKKLQKERRKAAFRRLKRGGKDW